MRELRELRLIQELTHYNDELIEKSELTQINVDGESYPIHGFCIGSSDPKAPTIGLFGGVHGLEKVGTHVVITYLTSLFKQLSWDKELRKILSHSRIVSIPLINPWGMAHNNRSNANGVDLMRNSPIDCEEENLIPLLSGHRLSNKLPWFRGEEGAAFEKECQTVIDFCQKHIFPSHAAITLDFHSGFGMKDRLWFPYAKSKAEFPRIKEVKNLTNILNEIYPHHIYHVEPQSASYTINGDLWDYLFEKHRLDQKTASNIFIPWTLEMGSWIWVKKNPFQLLRADGFFNPIKAHRHNRTMRRHLLLIDFFFRAIRNYESWS